MISRVCILLALLLAATNAAARIPRPGIHAPLATPRDTLETATTERNDRLYDSIRTKSHRRAVPRLLYGLLFVRPTADTLDGRVVDESRALAPYAGRTVGEIRIERQQVFDPDGNWLERTANKTHRLTRERVIRRDLLFRPGDPFDPQLIVRNKQLLRSRDYIAEAEIIPCIDPLDPTRIDLTVRTRDSWSITLDGAWETQGRTTATVYDANILGSGNTLRVETHFDRRDFSYQGNIVAYEIPNVLGSFFTARISGGRAFRGSEFTAELHKEFLRPTDYELGASYNDIKALHYMTAEDTSRLVSSSRLDLWGGYSRRIPSIRSSVFLSARYDRTRFGLRPPVGAGLHPALHDRDALLVGAGLYRERFLTASMIYGFGRREYLATGYLAEVVGGYAWGEFDDLIYLGANYRRGDFHNGNYLMSGISLGSYIDPTNGTWRHSAVDVELRWFSRLFPVRRSRIRQFLGLRYTQGWNRDRGADESIRFTRDDGLQAMREHVAGTNRMILNTETIFFTPWQPLGFRMALFGFADFGLLGYDANIFCNDFFTSFGIGLRIKNERLVFSTIQLRLGVAFGRRGLVGSEYFRISNARHLAEQRYSPARPEIVGFE